MNPRRPTKGYVPHLRPVQASLYACSYMRYFPRRTVWSEGKSYETRTPVFHISKLFQQRKQHMMRSLAADLSPSTKKRKVSINFEEHTYSSGTGGDNLKASINEGEVGFQSFYPVLDLELAQGEELCVEELRGEECLSKEQVETGEVENIKDVEIDDKCVGEDNVENGDRGDDDVDEQQAGKRRYCLRSHTGIRRLSIERNKEIARSLTKPPNREIRTKVRKDRRRDQSLVEKHHHVAEAEGSDDIMPSHIQPIQVDETISFDDIGGLSEYVNALKEMVFFPLLYPEFFESFHISPPRGVLLCGPPGTGKTLIARALACAASKVGQKVNFYMRKGADVMSKWVGEAEKHLKLLFEEAQKNQPSIIFFDEIDGLAPSRSSKQEQIHNSVVSTLLALMDGLDSRGQVILIGATNRVNDIDGALRRPGRFDREFNFPLPNCQARTEILDIHTRKWKQPPSKELKLELAAHCVGYCGADLKALCTEAAILAFREKYPQVYNSDNKFLIDVDYVKVEKYHFVEAMSIITPTARRSTDLISRPLSPIVSPCLHGLLQEVMGAISAIFPFLNVSSEVTNLSMVSRKSAIPLVYRSKLLLVGDDSVGMDHISFAVLHELEKFPIHSLALSSLYSEIGAKTLEGALTQVFAEAKRTAPSIIYLPQFHLWFENAYDQLRTLLRFLLDSLPSDLPILLLGTSSIPLADNLPSSLFDDRVFHLSSPSTEGRRMFFDHLIDATLQVPEVASTDEAPTLKEDVDAHEYTLHQLQMDLRDVCNRILKDECYSAFYHRTGMATLLQRVDNGKYITCNSFLEDFDLILTNAEKCYGGGIVCQANVLRDVVHCMISKIHSPLAATRMSASPLISAVVKAAQLQTQTPKEISISVSMIKQLLLENTKNYGISQLEMLYTRIANAIMYGTGPAKDPHTILKCLFEFASDESSFLIST